MPDRKGNKLQGATRAKDEAENAEPSQRSDQGLDQKPKKRLNLEFSAAASDLLEQLAASSDRSKTEVLRTGLALYGIAFEESRKGNALGIVKEGTVLKEIVWL
jgi:hypothetical protein